MWGWLRFSSLPALGCAFVLLVGCSSVLTGHGSVAGQCRAAFFGVPGSGQGAHNPAPPSVPPGVGTADALRYGTTIGRLHAELDALAGGGGLAEQAPVDYPAVSVLHYIGPGGLTGGLDASEAVGVTALDRDIAQARSGACADRPLLLAGYSQGAEVVIRAVSHLAPAQQAHLAVALFGNPSYEPQLAGDYPGDTGDAGIRPTFRHTAFTLPAGVRRATIDICAPGDPVCGVDAARTSTAGRVEYVITHVRVHEEVYAFGADGSARRAARFLLAPAH